ncbi:MAG: hypothetical protein H3C49_11770, partial [Alphaproteobacteria bacterium]|nr:hypothetical protein [Alphaproteobacteria bacterium]
MPIYRLLTNGDKKTAFVLAAAAQDSADTGNFEDALSYARSIGSAEYNRVVLGWDDGDGNPKKEISADYRKQREIFIAHMMIALQKQRQGQNAQGEIDQLIESIQRKPEGQHQQMLSAVAMLTGMNHLRPDLLAEAYAVTGRIEKAWDIFNATQTGNDPSSKMSVLAVLSDYYAEHPDKGGVRRVMDELKKFVVERWPQGGDLIYAGVEIGIHQRAFDILGALKSVSAIEETLLLTDFYTNQNLKMRSRLYGATALAKANSIEKAFKQFEKCEGAISSAASKSVSSHAERFMINLKPEMGENSRAENIRLNDYEFGNFIFAIAVSNATKDQKLSALKKGLDLLTAEKAGSALFRAQMAVAKAAIFQDEDSKLKMKDAQYGVPPSIFAGLLHKAGFHDEEIALIEASWMSADAPPAIGIERLGFSTGYQVAQHAERLAVLSGMLARDGRYGHARRVAHSINDDSAVPRIGGTDFATYFSQQKSLHSIAMRALQSGEEAVAFNIAKENITYRPYAAYVYFTLARAALAA